MIVVFEEGSRKLRVSRIGETRREGWLKNFRFQRDVIKEQEPGSGHRLNGSAEQTLGASNWALRA